MYDLLVDIANWIIAQEFAVADGEDIFRDYLPDAPDALVVVKEYDAIPVPTDRTVSNRLIQVLVRNTNPDEAKAKSNEIYRRMFDSFDMILHFTPQRWGICQPVSGPLQLGRDDNDRVRYVFSFSIITYTD